MSSNKSPEIKEVITYHDNGNVWLHYFTLNNKRHGEFKIHFVNGQLSVICGYDHGVCSGNQHTYYNNGVIKEESFYVNNIRHGEYKSYHDNGELARHCVYKEDIECGEFLMYYKNGILRAHYFYEDGKRHGEFKSYHNNGALLKHSFYNHGTEEALSEYIEDPDNITDAEFMNLSMVFGDNFFGTSAPSETPL